MTFFDSYLATMGKLIKDVDVSLLDEAASLLKGLQEQRKVILVGNGGSSTLASHIAIDLTKSAEVRAISLNEVCLITCFANDFGYERWVEKGLKYYADSGDVVVLISSSGMSANILNGAETAKAMGLRTITLSGFKADNALRTMGDVNLWVDSHIYNFVETVHQAWLVSIVDNLCEATSKK